MSSSSSTAPPYTEAVPGTTPVAGRFGEEQPAEVMNVGAAMDTVPALRNFPGQPPSQTING